MANRALLEKEIKEYCKLNGINDVAGFITQCILMGFNTFRYGTSPTDNIKRENGEIESKPTNRERKEKQPEVENKIEVKKRKIKVIHNDYHQSKK